MGKSTEFNLRTVPRLFDVIDEKVTRGGDLLVVDIFNKPAQGTLLICRHAMMKSELDFKNL